MKKHTIESLESLVGNLRSQVKELRTERNNFRAMYENAKERKHIAKLEAKITKQAEVIELLQEQNTLLTEQNEILKLRVDELERIVFGKGKRKDKNSSGSSGGSGNSGGSGSSGGGLGGNTPSIPTKRPPFSFRRKTPEEKDITETRVHTLSECPDCKHTLSDLKVSIRFSEDIPSLEDIQKLLHRTTKHSIETGYCNCCKKRKSAIPLSKQTVSIGPHVRRFICYSSVILNQSYSQTIQILSDLYGIVISDGEIAGILESEKMKLISEYEAIKVRIRNGAVVHLDETGWPVAKEEQGNYAWTMTNPPKESEIVFLLGRSRGRGNALELRGKDSSLHIGVTDDYGAYKNSFEKHQLCWAHPLRKFRDLKDSPSLEEVQRKLCIRTYEAFAKNYTSLTKILKEENEYFKNTGEWRIERISKKEISLRGAFQKLAILQKNDPKKMRTLKESLIKNEDKYFTCLGGPGIPTDNNKAERTLRHLVLKRRMSHGSKTQKGADIFAVLASVLLSLKAKHPFSFFSEYHKLMEGL